MKTLFKSIILFCILNLIFCIYSNAQIQQNNVRVVDTVYTPTGYTGGALSAILWLPSITNGAAVVIVHNAGGTPQSEAVYGDFFSSYGYVVISIDYYGFFHASGIPSLYPAPVTALKTAVEFLRRNTLNFGCFTGKVACLGFSQGAMTIGETITWDNDDSYFNTDPAINDHLDAVVCYYGLYDNYNHLESPFFGDGGNEATIADYFSLSPALRATKGNAIANVTNISTPVLLFHGTSDQVWSVGQSIEFNDTLIAYGKSRELNLFPGGDHIFDFQGTISPHLNIHDNHLTTEGIISRDTALAFISRTLKVNNIHCPYGKSYWKNHPSLWNSDATPMKLGTVNSYSKTQLLAILNSSGGNDPSLKLAQDLIAAKLNLANNSYASPIVSTIIAADNLIGARAIPVIPFIASNSTEASQMTALGNTFQSYNNGIMTPNCNSSRMAKNNSLENVSMNIFPNPFSSSTIISFSFVETQKISVKIYDITGRLVTTLADGRFEEGTNKVEWNVGEEQAGIYILRMEVRGYLRTEKLVVVK